MGGLYGWSGYGGNPGHLEEVLAAMARPIGGGTGAWTRRTSGLGAAGAALFAEGDLAAAVVGRPGWRREDLAELARQEGDAAALLRSYRELGVRVLCELTEDFAVAVLDSRAASVLVACDRAGICPVYVERSGNTLLFGSDGRAMDAHPSASFEIEPQGIYDYLYFGVVPAPDSIRRGRSRLLPGEYVLFRDGGLDRAGYWTPSYDEDDDTALDALERELDELLRASVRRDAGGAKTGAFLSGGVDSSTVAGILSQVSGETARTYSIGFDAEGYNELGFAKITADRFGTKHREYYVTPTDVVEAVPKIAGIYAEPFGNESAVPTYYCARMAAEDGVERLLAGDGGDELFGGNERYAKQKLFSAYGRVPAVARGALEAVLRAFPLGDRIWPVRKARRYVEQARQPLAQRLQAYALIEMYGAERIFEPGFLAGVDRARPLALMQEVIDGAGAGCDLNRMLALDMKFILADGDLPKVTRMCELAGVEVAFPLLSTEIMDFAARLRPGLKLKGFRLRWFFKRAVRDLLARDTLTKSKHGFGLPFGVWLRTDRALKELAHDNLAGLRTRGILREDFLDELIVAHEQKHSAYYGEIIWACMMLEQWHRIHVDQAADAPSVRS